MHLYVDFLAPPLFEISLGQSISIMFFQGSTVVRVHGGTYYTIPLPFYVIIAAAVAIPLVIWFALRRRNHG